MTSVLYWIFTAFVLVMEESTTLSAVNDSKLFVCSGDFIRLFRNITTHSTDIVVSLFIKASTNRHIAVWTLGNAVISVGYSRKVFRDQYGDIWIRNVSSSDEGQYKLKVRKGSNVSIHNVDLVVLTAPTLNCKPKVIRIEDVLVASLEANECGNPPAYVDWLNYLGNHSEGKYSVMLPREYPAGTYYACIGGPALMCARSSKLSDYCTSVQIEGEHGSQEFITVSEREYNKSTFDLEILIAVIGICVVLVVSLLLWICRHTRLCYDLKTTAIRKTYDYAVPTDKEALGIASTPSLMTTIKNVPEKHLRTSTGITLNVPAFVS